MIPAITCLLVPFISGCSAYVDSVPSISALEQRRAQYSGEAVRVTGEVRRLQQWRSNLSGREYEIFMLCGTDCVRVFMQARSPIRSGERVTVRGRYFLSHTAGRDTYYNEIEATEILARE